MASVVVTPQRALQANLQHQLQEAVEAAVGQQPYYKLSNGSGDTTTRTLLRCVCETALKVATQQQQQ